MYRLLCYLSRRVASLRRTTTAAACGGLGGVAILVILLILLVAVAPPANQVGRLRLPLGDVPDLMAHLVDQVELNWV